MKTITVRELSRKTASVLDALQNGETFELRRSGKAVGYLTRTAPPLDRKPDWKAHFEWLRKQPKHYGGFVKELDVTIQTDRDRSLGRSGWAMSKA